MLFTFLLKESRQPNKALGQGPCFGRVGLAVCARLGEKLHQQVLPLGGKCA